METTVINLLTFLCIVSLTGFFLMYRCFMKSNNDHSYAVKMFLEEREKHTETVILFREITASRNKCFGIKDSEDPVIKGLDELIIARLPDNIYKQSLKNNDNLTKQ